MGKNTVAIIGDTGEFCPALVKAVMQQELRLLFISGDEVRISRLKEELQQLPQKAEVEFINCEKEGCWEADIIAFTRPTDIQPLLLNRIKQVSTQKVVLVISHSFTEDLSGTNLHFQDLLPHSKVVEVELEEKNFRIFGKYEEANSQVRNFFNFAAYQQKQ